MTWFAGAQGNNTSTTSLLLSRRTTKTFFTILGFDSTAHLLQVAA